MGEVLPHPVVKLSQHTQQLSSGVGVATSEGDYTTNLDTHHTHVIARDDTWCVD